MGGSPQIIFIFEQFFEDYNYNVFCFASKKNLYPQPIVLLFVFYTGVLIYITEGEKDKKHPKQQNVCVLRSFRVILVTSIKRFSNFHALCLGDLPPYLFSPHYFFRLCIVFIICFLYIVVLQNLCIVIKLKTNE